MAAHCWSRLRRHSPSGHAIQVHLNRYTDCWRCGRVYKVGTQWGGPK